MLYEFFTFFDQKYPEDYSAAKTRKVYTDFSINFYYYCLLFPISL